MTNELIMFILTLEDNESLRIERVGYDHSMLEFRLSKGINHRSVKIIAEHELKYLEDESIVAILNNLRNELRVETHGR